MSEQVTQGFIQSSLKTSKDGNCATLPQAGCVPMLKSFLHNTFLVKPVLFQHLAVVSPPTMHVVKSLAPLAG